MNALGNYKVLSILGEGTFGIVKLAQDKMTKENVAIKTLEKKKIKDEKDKFRVKTEIEILKRMSHLNVIKTKKIFKDSENIYIIMEYCEKGELFNHIEKETHLSNDEAACYFYQLINGLEYIHQKGIVHRDLKLENILLNKNNILKIIDFGLSNHYDKNELLTTPCGSPSYASPEILSGKQYDGIMIDIWSTGIILYAMLCGYLPFDDENQLILYQKIINCELDIPEHLEEDSVDMLKKILVNDPKKRITIKEIKKHKFYNKGKKEFIRSHPNIVNMTYKKLKNTGQNGRNKGIKIIKNNSRKNQHLKTEGNNYYNEAISSNNLNNNNKNNNNKSNNKSNNKNNNKIKLNEPHSIAEEKYINDEINNIFKKELMKNIFKRKIKINLDSLMINSININNINDIKEKSQKNGDSIDNNNTFIKLNHTRDIKPDIIKNDDYIDSNNKKTYSKKYKSNKTFNNKNTNNNNNNINISKFKNIFINQSIDEKEYNNYNKSTKNADVKKSTIPFNYILINNRKKSVKKKNKFMLIKNIKSIINNIELDSHENKVESKTPRAETTNSNLTKERNNNFNYRPTISEYNMKIKKRIKNLNKNTSNPKQYHKKVFNKDGNLYLKINSIKSMKDYDVTKEINNDIHIFTLDNTLTDSTKDKIINKSILKENKDYLNYKLKLNNKNQLNYKNSDNKTANTINSSIELSKTLSNNNYLDNINNNIIYKRLFNQDKKPNEINKNDNIDKFNKKNINEKKLELKGFKNNERTDYILIENNDKRNSINYNNNEKMNFINDITKKIYSNSLINSNKIKESKTINNMRNHFIKPNIKNKSLEIKELDDTNFNPKKYYKYNLNINKNRSIFQNNNNNKHSYKKHIKKNLIKNHNYEKIKSNLEKKKYNKLLSNINNNINSFNLMNDITKSLDDINTNFSNDKMTGDYPRYYNLKTDYN